MTSRKNFVTVAAASVGALTAIPALAQRDADSPPPSPLPSPSASPPPSPAARAFAERMRAFDPGLTDAQIASIASGVETNWQLGKTVNHNGIALANSDEPVPAFSVRS